MPTDHEGPLHRAIHAYLRLVFPLWPTHHSPNAIGLSGRTVMRQIAKNRDMGTVKGWPDLEQALPVPLPRLFFEVKATGNYPDKDQRALHDQLRGMGHWVFVVRSVREVFVALAQIGAFGWPGVVRAVPT